MLHKVHIRTKDSTDVVPDEEMVYTFNPRSDILQKHGYTGIHNGEITFMQLETGSGKTRIMNYGTIYYLLQGGSVAITTPIKALSNQKYNEYITEFMISLKEQTGKEFTVGLMTGDNKINPDADVIIMTTEILRNSLNHDGKDEDNEKRLRPRFMDRLMCVIFDEAHYINDEDRGGVWEATIMLLQPSINLILLSATMDEIEKFAKWLSSVRNRDVRLVTSSKRIVPLRHYIFNNDMDEKLLQIMTEDNHIKHENIHRATLEYKNSLKTFQKKPNIGLLNQLIKYMRDNDLFQAIFFSFSRNNCERFAKSVNSILVTPEESSQIEKIFNKHMHKYESTFKSLTQFYKIKDLLMKGIAYHHSGLIPILKEIVEIIFKCGLIKILFATETFAVGINMPTRTVVFTDLEKPTKKKRRYIEPAEYKQMSGRAGRRGIDTNGTVIILPLYDLPDIATLEQVLTGKLPGIKSHLKLDYSFIMKTIATKNFELGKFLESSLGSRDDGMRHSMLEIAVVAANEELQHLSTKTFSRQSVDIFEELKKFDSLSNSLGGMELTLTKKQKKRKGVLERMLTTDPALNDDYDLFERKRNLEQEITRSEREMIGIKTYMKNICVELIQVLAIFGYVDVGNISTTIDPEDSYTFGSGFITINNMIPIHTIDFDNILSYTLTTRGKIASQINECNPILLTELITNDLLHGLTAAEIVGVLSIFIDDSNPKNRKGKSDLIATPAIKKAIEKLDYKSEKYMEIEGSFGYTDEKYWEIHYDYVDAGYDWASGKDINTIILQLETYEGNFIRNMIKLYNIVKDIRCLLAIYDDLRLIPILQDIDVMLIRDEVTIRSLYLE